MNAIPSISCLIDYSKKQNRFPVAGRKGKRTRFQKTSVTQLVLQVNADEDRVPYVPPKTTAPPKLPEVSVDVALLISTSQLSIWSHCAEQLEFIVLYGLSEHWFVLCSGLSEAEACSWLVEAGYFCQKFTLTA